MSASDRPTVSYSAPGKLMLAGSHAVVHGQPCLVTAVDQRLTVTVAKNGEDVLHLHAPDMGLQTYSKTIADLGKKQLPKAVQFIEVLYRQWLDRYPQAEGITVTTRSQFSSTFGFGSSSAATVAFAKALTKLYEIELTNHELFALCHQATLAVQGVGSGFDLAAAIWGGTLFYVAPARVAEPLRLPELPLVVGYTGVKADTPTLVRMVDARLEQEPEIVQPLFAESGEITHQLRTALEQQDWPLAGELLTQHHRVAQQLGVSSPELERLFDAALAAGADGATLSGAGGGDCLVALVTAEQRAAVMTAINQAGGEALDIGLQAEGVKAA